MNEKQREKWAKWHKRGYAKYMLANLGIVLAFYAFSGTIAFVQLYVMMPPSIKARGGGVPIWPALLVVCVMTPVAMLLSHIMWKRNESKYQELTQQETD